MGDDRRTDSDRLELRPPSRLRTALLEHYSADEYPSLNSEQEIWMRAAEDAMRDRSEWVIVFTDDGATRQRIEEFLGDDFEPHEESV